MLVPSHYKEIIMIQWFKALMGVSKKPEEPKEEIKLGEGTHTSPVVIKAPAKKKTTRKKSTSKKKASKK